MARALSARARLLGLGALCFAPVQTQPQTTSLPEGQSCPTACVDAAVGCPAPGIFTGSNAAPELYVDDPNAVPWPSSGADALCLAGSNVADCCKCGGGYVPPACPTGHEMTVRIEGSRYLRSQLSVLIGSIVDAVPSSRTSVLRRDMPTGASARVRLLQVSYDTVETLVPTPPPPPEPPGPPAPPPDGNDNPFAEPPPPPPPTMDVMDVTIVKFYFANWYSHFKSALDLEAAFAVNIGPNSNRRNWRILNSVTHRQLPPLLRLAPPQPVVKDYPNSIAWAEYKAGAGRDVAQCSAGQPRDATHCRQVYTHFMYPPEPRDLTRNTTDDPMARIWGGPSSRRLVPDGRFVMPACWSTHTLPANRTYGNESCPVEDWGYCDEFHSLDVDCDGVLSLQEARETTTWFGAPSYHALTPLSMVDSGSGSGITSMLMEHTWDMVLGAADGDDGGSFTIFDWLKISRVYKPTYRHCGEVLADRFFRWSKQSDRPRGGTNGAFPIKPCDTCPERWIYCDLDTRKHSQSHYNVIYRDSYSLVAGGGGWNLVYEGVGRTDFLMTTDAINTEQLFAPDRGRVSGDKCDQINNVL